MKKSSFILTLFCSLNLLTKATIHHIGVDGCSFNPPANNTIVLGDTLHWFLDANTPRKTSSLNLPPGATAWDATLDVTHKDFYYIPSVPGQYFYKSNIMPTCIASFVVSYPTGLKQLNPLGQNCVFFPNPASTSFILIHPKNATTLEILDKNGELLKTEVLDPKETNDEILTGSLKPGSYMIVVKQKKTIIFISKLLIAN
ncbi:MAG: T9SS type A sorting domain-containing protein [Bacteroidetes bacterium]|nr:T9SS type A sorting domain-containing protein [Bacteroidota bacterium]